MIAEKIAHIKEQLPEGVRLVAVSKLKSVDDIREAYAAGQRIFGENYATELRDKATQLPADIAWHFIGHLQGKQIKYYMPFVGLIEGVDSEAHLLDVEHAAAHAQRQVRVLLQLHVAQESTKFGFAPDEVMRLGCLDQLHHVQICGVMGMASHTTDERRVRDDFRQIRRLFDQLREGPMAGCADFSEVSMGMSHDWHIAVEEGSTMVRLGTAIFGERDYSLRTKQ